MRRFQLVLGLATFASIASPAAAQGALLEQEHRADLRACDHRLALQRFARQKLLDATSRYGTCIDAGLMVGCSADFEELQSARDEYAGAIEDAQAECPLAGIAVTTPLP